MKADDLKNIDFSKITTSHASASLLWFSSISRKEKWSLSEREQCQILGGWDIDIYQQKLLLCLNGDLIELDKEIIVRLSLLLKFHKLLETLSPENFDSSLLFNTLNSGDFLNGSSIREYLLKDSSLDRYFELKNYLEAITAGEYS